MTVSDRREDDRRLDVAERFFAALRQGDEVALWACFSTAARRFVAERGIRRGLSPDLAEALVAGTAAGPEQQAFLADLIAGVEKDLERVRIDRLLLDPDPHQQPDGRVRVLYLETFDVAGGPPLPPLPVGSLILVEEDGDWRIDRLVPRPS